MSILQTKTRGFCRRACYTSQLFSPLQGKRAEFDSRRYRKEAYREETGGYSDPAILCAECEKKFNQLDHYGFKILGRSNLTEKPLYREGFPYAYEINCETDKLHRFLLSVLWRASVSGLPAFSTIQLRQYQEPLLHDIFASSPIDSQQYQTIVFKLDDDFLGPFSHIMFEPVGSFQKDKTPCASCTCLT
jgi:hypothetical protein